MTVWLLTFRDYKGRLSIGGVYANAEAAISAHPGVWEQRSVWWWEAMGMSLLAWEVECGVDDAERVVPSRYHHTRTLDLDHSADEPGA